MPDRVPIVPIYDLGYVMNCIGRDVREWITTPSQKRIGFIEAAFPRHEVDGYFVHAGNTDEWVEKHSDQQYKKRNE